MRRNQKKHIYFIKKTSKSIYDSAGKIIYFSYQDFLEKIVIGHCCFICGAEPNSKPFSGEHIIPKWILKHYGDKDSFIILPNKTEIKNNNYLIPCCNECNADLGLILENPISSLLRKNYRDVCDELENDENLYLKIYHWAALIFFKTHLKDTYLLKERDTRKTSGTIADNFCWHHLFHVHNIVRHHYSGTKISKNAYGTILIFESLMEQKKETFDYLDNLDGQIIMIQVGKIVIFVVINDCCACLSLYRTFFNKINGSLSSIQIREIFARLRYITENLKYEARFSTLFKGKYPRIIAHTSNKLELFTDKNEKTSLFKLMRFYIGDLIPVSLSGKDKLLRDLEEGKAQYIFDENYNFHQFESYKEE